MAQGLKLMSVDELINKIPTGERNFKRMKLPDGSDLSGHERYPELQEYLRKQNLERTPLDFSGSQLVGVNAKGLYLPYVIALEINLKGANLYRANLNEAHLEEAHFERAHLNEAYLRRANFNGAHLERAHLAEANLKEAKLNGAHLEEAHLEKADLEKADLEEARLYGAYLWGVYFYRADLRGVLGLSKAKSLGNAHFLDAVVGEAEELVIRRAQPGAKLYVVR